MPQTTREINDIRWFLGIKANDERRRVNGIDDISIVGVGSEVFVILKKPEKKRAEQARGILTLAQMSRFDAVSVPTAGYSRVVLSKMCLICLQMG